MLSYANKTGRSGVCAYQCGLDFIDVRYLSGKTYRYSYRSAGNAHVEHMKRLAVEGRGLAAYISQHARDLYER